MDFPTAIRLGAKKTGLIEHTLFEVNDVRLSACALGAAIIGAGIATVQSVVNESDRSLRKRLREMFPVLTMKFDVCPVPQNRRRTTQMCKRQHYIGEDLVVHLNDYHGWNRGRIARYFEQL